VKDAVTMLLVHARVNVEARIAELGDLLCEQLNSLRGVAEDDGLIDLQLDSTHSSTRFTIQLNNTRLHSKPVVGSLLAHIRIL